MKFRRLSVRQKNVRQHIFNAYPSPTLIELNQTLPSSMPFHGVWSIEGTAMDAVTIEVLLHVFYDNDIVQTRNWTLNVLVTQPERRIDRIFQIMIPCLVGSISILMGILLDPAVITGIMKKPTPVLIGFIAQYGLMPMLAMGIAKLFRYTPLNSLALFVIGCCPGKELLFVQ
jgi:hypothetical protein